MKLVIWRNLKAVSISLNSKQLKKMTREQKKEQVISNIYGLMDYDSTVTKEEIRKALDSFCGIYDS